VGVGRVGSLFFPGSRRAQVVLLEEEVDVDATPARVENRLRDRVGVDLLHRDVERRACAADEVDDDLLEVVSRAKLLRADEDLDLPVGERSQPAPIESGAATADKSLRC
jgi:hypothetical protein